MVHYDIDIVGSIVCGGICIVLGLFFGTKNKKTKQYTKKLSCSMTKKKKVLFLGQIFMEN